jgi:hypothetical protein
MEIYGCTRYEMPSIAYTQSYKLLCTGISKFIASVNEEIIQMGWKTNKEMI